MKKSQNKKTEIVVDDWLGCYPSNWKGLIVDKAMSHPAKYSNKLIRRIYEHALECDWVHEGDKVIDPFGGVALGGLDAMRIGLHWTGIELEKKFVELGGTGYDCMAFSKKFWKRYFGLEGFIKDLRSHQLLCPDCESLMQPKTITDEKGFVTSRTIPEIEPHRFLGNIALWNSKFGRMPHWGSARLLQGDSRKLMVAIGSQQLVVSSPPYEGTRITETGKYMDSMRRTHEERYSDTPGQLGAMKSDDFDAAISSPPYNLPTSQGHNGKRGGTRGNTPSEPGAFVRYGNTDGNLEGMNDGGFDLALSSPPFLQSSGGAHIPKGMEITDPGLAARHAAGNAGSHAYGTSEGQMSSMADAGFDMAVSSPPFENSLSRDFMDAQARRDHARAHGISNAEHISPIDLDRLKAPDQVYGDTAGNIGNDSGDSFWLAARAIVDQVYLALKPGGHAIWVVKGYVKNKKYVDFPDQWRQLCEAAGFKTLHEHHAQLVHRKGASMTLDGGTVEHKTESKSFFRRLAEKKGSPRIDWETVFCMVKPSDQLLAISGEQDLAVSSPPYADSVNNPQKGGIDWEKAGRPDRLIESDHRHGVQGIAPVHYGSTPGQLGAMKSEGFDMAVSSPPYQNMEITGENNFASAKHPDGKKARKLKSKDKHYGT